MCMCVCALICLKVLVTIANVSLQSLFFGRETFGFGLVSYRHADRAHGPLLICYPIRLNWHERVHLLYYGLQFRHRVEGRL